jgi:hypothetical protein
MANICPHCRQEMPQPSQTPVSDAQIVRALSVPREEVVKGKRVKMWPWLYASSDGGRGADLRCWYVTGPPDRDGYVKGPFPADQVRRIARSGRIEPEVIEHGEVLAYKLAEAQRPMTLRAADWLFP